MSSYSFVTVTTLGIVMWSDILWSSIVYRGVLPWGAGGYPQISRRPQIYLPSKMCLICGRNGQHSERGCQLPLLATPKDKLSSKRTTPAERTCEREPL